MSFVGNLLWFVFGGGVFYGLVWLLAGCLWCITIIGIPIGIACFRVASFAFLPFGKELVPAEIVGEKAVAGSGFVNVLWCIFSGFWLSVAHVLTGLGYCCTIILIPFGLAHFKIAKASFAPLGKRIVNSEMAKAAYMAAAQAKLAAATGQMYQQPGVMPQQAVAMPQQPQAVQYQQPQAVQYQQPTAMPQNNVQQ